MYGQNILRGETLLDNKYPVWLDVIDLPRLDLSSTASCVLGQIATHDHGEDPDSWYGAYEAGLTLVGLEDEGDDYGERNGPAGHGFDYGSPSPLWRVRFDGDEQAMVTYRRLTAEWHAAVTSRLAGDNGPDAVAYAYDAGLHHADCILVKMRALTADENAARKFTVEHALTVLRPDFGLPPTGVPDLNVFPVAASDADLVREDGTPASCDTCLQAIEP